MRIPFNRPNMTGEEFQFMSEAHLRGQIAGDGFFTAQCSEYLKQLTGAAGALLTTSASSALDMSAILLDLKPGDEVILPHSRSFRQPTLLLCGVRFLFLLTSASTL